MPEPMTAAGRVNRPSRMRAPRMNSMAPEAPGVEKTSGWGKSRGGKLINFIVLCSMQAEPVAMHSGLRTIGVPESRELQEHTQFRDWIDWTGNNFGRGVSG